MGHAEESRGERDGKAEEPDELTRRLTELDWPMPDRDLRERSLERFLERVDTDER